MLLRGSKNKDITGWMLTTTAPNGKKLHGAGMSHSEGWWKSLCGLLVGQGLLEYKTQKVRHVTQAISQQADEYHLSGCKLVCCMRLLPKLPSVTSCQQSANVHCSSIRSVTTCISASHATVRQDACTMAAPPHICWPVHTHTVHCPVTYRRLQLIQCPVTNCLVLHSQLVSGTTAQSTSPLRV